jgi:hypothetical protein
MQLSSESLFPFIIGLQSAKIQYKLSRFVYTFIVICTVLFLFLGILFSGF